LGTIGFIVAMWITNLTGNKATEYQFIAGLAAVVLGIYSFTLPKPQRLSKENASIMETLGLESLNYC
jgi:NHS family xanthosine MFS transporter